MRRRWDKSKNLRKGENYVWNISFQVSLWFLKLPNFSLLRKRYFNVFLLNHFEPSYSIHFDISPLDPLFPICLLSVTSRYWNAKKTSWILPPILSRGVEIQVFFSISLSFFNLSVVKKILLIQDWAKTRARQSKQVPTTLGFHSILFSWPISHFMPRKVMFARHGFHVLDILPLHKMFVLIPPSNGEMKRDTKGLLFLPFFSLTNLFIGIRLLSPTNL